MKLTEQKLREIIQEEIKSLNENKEAIIKVDDSNFKSTVYSEIKRIGHNADLNHIDVSKVTDMSSLFSEYNNDNETATEFNGDISKWNTSKVVNMQDLFRRCKFNGDISKWNTSKVTDIAGMFWRSKFNGDISKWNTSNVVNMNYTFQESEFTGNISKWNVSNTRSMTSTFNGSKFNGDISKWDVSSVNDIRYMFYSSYFNGDISKWNTSNVSHLAYVFDNSKFNGDVSKWNLPKARREERYNIFTDPLFKGNDSVNALRPMNLSVFKKRHKAVGKEFPNVEIVDHKRGVDKRYSVYIKNINPWKDSEFKVSVFEWYENTVIVRYTSKTNKNMIATYKHKVTVPSEFISILKKNYVKSDWN